MELPQSPSLILMAFMDTVFDPSYSLLQYLVYCNSPVAVFVNDLVAGVVSFHLIIFLLPIVLVLLLGEMPQLLP